MLSLSILASMGTRHWQSQSWILVGPAIATELRRNCWCVSLWLWLFVAWIVVKRLLNSVSSRLLKLLSRKEPVFAKNFGDHFTILFYHLSKMWLCLIILWHRWAWCGMNDRKIFFISWSWSFQDVLTRTRIHWPSLTDPLTLDADIASSSSPTN